MPMQARCTHARPWPTQGGGRTVHWLMAAPSSQGSELCAQHVAHLAHAEEHPLP